MTEASTGTGFSARAALPAGPVWRAGLLAALAATVVNGLAWVLLQQVLDAGLQIPSAVDLAVTETQPGLKGDTASGGGSKPATLETGVTIDVPLFIDEGETVRVDTRSGEYVSRA